MQGSFHCHSQEAPLSELWQGNDSVRPVRAPTKDSSKFLCTTETWLHCKMCTRVLSSQVLLCAWAASSQLMLAKGWGGVWLLYSNKLYKAKGRIPCWDLRTLLIPTESLWTTAVSSNEPGQPALPGVMHTQLSCRDRVSLCFLSKPLEDHSGV